MRVLPGVGLSPETRRRLEMLFPAGPGRDEAAALLEQECGTNLPFLGDADARELERFRFAALKMSGGDLGKLYEAVDVAQTDWRDLLVAAGFGADPAAHRAWLPGGGGAASTA